ncbi:MAG TPA: S49 family peptidase [Candidatus Polarisedimenticolia bacterium]|nr:S49 family peptidase [Candidatus Polarisedimenticolia bacterium]
MLFPFRYLWWLIGSLRARLGRPPDYVTFLIEEEMPVLPDPPIPLWQRFFRRQRLSLRELGRRFAVIEKDPRVKGVALHLRPVPMSLAVLQDMRELVARLRKSGKRVIAWAPFYTTGTYYLACACDEILMLPTGIVQPLGLSSTGMFLAQGLARVGIQADFVQVSPYKTAADVLTRSKMSDEMREQIRWLLKSQHEQLVDAIKDGRKLDADAALQVIDGSPYTDEQALARKVVDAVLSEEQLPQRLSSGAEVRIGDWDQARRRMSRPAPRLRLGNYVAIIRIEGTIIDGRSGRPPVAPPVEVPIVGDPRAGDLTVVQVARQVAADRRAAAVVVYVDSRGGSATASEAMRQALAVVAAKKPVVTAMGPVAGSGGYWVATPGRWIVARPGTLTGSIGVLTGKLITGGLWAKLLVNRETVAEGRRAVMEGDENPYTAEERQIVQSMIDRTYGMFLDIVATARGVVRSEIEPLAGGKVWTGAQALERKLVDELGGLDAALAKARTLAGLPDTTPALEVHPPRRALAPQTLPTASGLAGYLLEGVTLFNRTPVQALMELLCTKA